MQEHLFVHIKSEGHSVFLRNVSIAIIDKADGRDSEMREKYWIRTLQTYAPFVLNIEDSVWPILCRSINVTGELTCLVFLWHIG